MKLQTFSKIIGIGAVALIMAGCGGGSSGGSTPPSDGGGNNPPVDQPGGGQPPVNSDILDFGTSPASEEDFISVWGDNFYYKINGCDGTMGYGQFYYEAYKNNTITITYDTRYEDNKQSSCSIDKKFEPVNIVNGPVNGVRLRYYLYYDNSTGIYYRTDGYANVGDTMIEVINDGQTAVIKDSSGTRSEVFIERTYKEVSLSLPGNPPASNPELVDFGNSESSYIKTVDVLGTDFYYKINGCDGTMGYGQFYYEAFSNNMMTITYDTRYENGVKSSCRSPRKFIPVVLSDGMIDGNRLLYNLYYDNTSKIYYETDGHANVGDKLVEVINNGQTGVILRADGTRDEQFIKRAFKSAPLN